MQNSATNKLDFLWQFKTAHIALALVLVVAALSHGFNMFQYPYYEADEGTYMSQAWAVRNLGQLAPYTYTYDHSPVGWLQIAAWDKLTGGIFSFGYSINSGRVLMLLLHVFCAGLLFAIAKKVSSSTLVATLAALLFSLSPLGIYFHRRVLLDNIMMFWFLLSLFLVLGDGRKLSHFALSAAAFAIATLSKETAIFFLPVMIYAVHLNSATLHKKIAVGGFMVVFALLVAMYPFGAWLNDELFPAGPLADPANGHVSLIGTFNEQLSRDGGFFLDRSSEFATNFIQWIRGGFFVRTPDPVLMVAGIICTIWITFLGLKDKQVRIIALLSLSYWLYLIRGGVVIFFYVIPLIALMSLAIALAMKHASALYRRAFRFEPGKPGVLLEVFILFLSPFLLFNVLHQTVYRADQTSSQVAAVEWVKEHVPAGSSIIIDNFSYVELNDPRLAVDGKSFSAEYYWKVEYDLEIRQGKLADDWRNVDYLLMSRQMDWDVRNGDFSIVREALENSEVVQHFSNDEWDLEVRQVIKNEQDRFVQE